MQLLYSDSSASFARQKMYMVACGFKHNLALSMHVEVFAWRAGKFGVTGLFDLKKIMNMLIPLKIQHLEGKSDLNSDWRLKFNNY